MLGPGLTSLMVGTSRATPRATSMHHPTSRTDGRWTTLPDLHFQIRLFAHDHDLAADMGVELVTQKQWEQSSEPDPDEEAIKEWHANGGRFLTAAEQRKIERSKT